MPAETHCELGGLEASPGLCGQNTHLCGPSFLLPNLLADFLLSVPLIVGICLVSQLSNILVPWLMRLTSVLSLFCAVCRVNLKPAVLLQQAVIISVYNL